jgi:putative tryptophan/tyrosine transport system substrate-binding protein
MMHRRAFVTGLGAGAVLVIPLRVRAQQSDKRYRLGLLINYPFDPKRAIGRVFIPALQDLGYIQDQNLQIAVRSAHHHPERLPDLAADLVRLKVDVIVTGGDSEVRAAKQATNTIPIVMAPSGDPVRAGYVATYARPGGNVTGLSWMSPDLSAKLLQIVRETLPNASRLAVLWNSANPVKVLDFEETRRAADALRFNVTSAALPADTKVETVFAAIRRARVDALVILTDETLSAAVYPQIVDFAMQQHLPSILGESNYAVAGGLIGYGPSGTELWRRAAHFVDKILKGASPADLPVEQPTKFDLIINLKTAKTLGLTIPPSLLLRADQVIE